ncbi:hypothetical protein [Roseomonas populi]|uniref:Meckel syndrome type 1 protein n=1 Tax=Roseomonas populi TaxID=3121582 RepID=A0ABT1X3R6_9PROT|nr:hypothetical protein [Roseomonas pecuniae]MCR0982750.1 hypothetical protein [Roseomonas pecuniae]
MSNYLDRLVARALRETPALQPRAPLLFGPAPAEATLGEPPSRAAPERPHPAPPRATGRPRAEGPGRHGGAAAPTAPATAPLQEQRPGVPIARGSAPPGRSEPEVEPEGRRATEGSRTAGKAAPLQSAPMDAPMAAPAVAALPLAVSAAPPAPAAPGSVAVPLLPRPAPDTPAPDRPPVRTAPLEALPSGPRAAGQAEQPQAKPSPMPAAPAPVVIEIGAIEFRAPPPAAPATLPGPRRPALSLGDYLARRDRRPG